MKTKEFLKEKYEVFNTNDDHTDHEVKMAKTQLKEIVQNALETFQLVKQVNEDTGLPGWVQSKLTKADDYMTSVRKSLEGMEYDRQADQDAMDYENDINLGDRDD